MSATTTMTESTFSPLTLSIAPPPKVAALEICPVGDIVISLSTDQDKEKSENGAPKPPLRFRVSSAVLCAASPVFNAMLGPTSTFSEAISLRSLATTPDTDAHIQPLFDDNGVALAVILYAIHLQTSKVPRKVTFKQLKELAVTCDKYDCVGAVRLWAETWMEPWRGDVLTVGHEDWLFISWVFSSKKQFAKITKHLIPKIVISENTEGEKMPFFTHRRGRDPERLTAFDQYTPDVILKALCKKRETIMREILTLCSSTFVKYLAANVVLCKHEPKDERCDAYILGSLCKAFKSIGIFSLGSSSFDFNQISNYSIEELVRALQGIKIEHLDYDSWGGSGDEPGHIKVEHSKTCDPLKTLLEEVQIEADKVEELNLNQFRGWKRKKVEKEGGSWQKLTDELAVARVSFG